MKYKYCLQTNVVKNGRLSYDQYYKCKDYNCYFLVYFDTIKSFIDM